MKNKSILFINPDYHCSFFYRDELRKLGWKADIYVPSNYPEKLLYSDEDILRIPKLEKIPFIGRYLKSVYMPIYFLCIFSKYKYHFYSCGLDQFSFFENKIGLNKILGNSFRVHLWISKLFKIKIIHNPMGLPDEEMPEIVAKYGNEEEKISTYDPIERKQFFDIVRRYSDMILGFGNFNSSQYKATHIKYRVIDLNLWHPSLEVPKPLLLSQTNKLRILHSFMFSNSRIGNQKGNIKGSQYIKEAIEKLIEEGYNVDFMFLDQIPSNKMRFYQIQADIIVEEIVRGWYGSTAVETMALGKPVISFLRQEWQEQYYERFPETFPIPILSANKANIYDVLKELVINKDLRIQKGLESRKWAESHLNPVINTPNLVKELMKL